MPSPRKFVPLALLCLLFSFSAAALELRSYDAAVHDRFVDFPENPSFNPTFLFDPKRLVGVGWDSDKTYKQFALVSRCHVIFAAHHAPAIGSRVSFLSASGNIIERTVSRTRTVSNPTQSTSDVSLITLSSPITPADGVEPLPYLNLPSEEDYAGLPLVVLGSQAKAGQATLVDFRTINVNWIVSRTYRFNYLNADGGTDDARLADGDSGSPTLTTVDGVPALLGVHVATAIDDGVQSNYDAFIPHYVGQIDSIIAANGFRMRPLNATSTELGCTASFVSADAYEERALKLEFILENLGDARTGNVELEVSFPDEAAPDSVTAEGWVVTGGGNRWMLRRAVLETGASSTIIAHWTTAPSVETIQPRINWISDSSPEGSMEKVISLPPSFASWAGGFGEFGEMEDPDKDGIPNIVEYAFGSDPLSGGNARAVGVPPSPSFIVRDGLAIYSHPERTDKAERGLVYSPEWSRDLKSGSWSSAFPEGFSTSTSSYFPGVPGFTERVLSWPVQSGPHFVRLNIEEGGVALGP